jgi:hypothetical protein
MLKKELKVALALMGTIVPFAAQADQPMAASPSPKAQPSYAAGEAMEGDAVHGAYNQSASYVIADGWDAYLTADYIYWHLVREGDGVELESSYKSGFQVGLGLAMKGMDDWNMYGEYTWYQNNAGDDSSSENDRNKFHYNDAFLELQRPFYFGKALTANFGMGLRGLWISDDVDAYGVHSEQKSWAVGPRFEFASSWLLGCGFKIMGDLAQSVLYTKYSQLSGLVYNCGFSTLRPVTEASLGLGWGSYFGDNDDFHFDLTVGYDFNVYWDQHLGSFDSSGNSYLHGLNVGLRLDF